ncbi:hypothetical protein BDV12DRAFT_141123 [Aspergillus spectabilis]
MPGGAWPFTSRHVEQMSTRRFFGWVSSSPRRTSRRRSYHRECSMYCCGAGKAFGAKPGSSKPGGGGGGWLCWGCCCCGGEGGYGDGGCSEGGSAGWGRRMFAVGGGGRPVRWTGACCCCCVEGFRFPSALGFWSPFERACLGESPAYFSRSCWVELYFVATLSFSIVSSRCFWRLFR